MLFPDYRKFFREAREGDLCLTFGPPEYVPLDGLPLKMPLIQASIKTETEFEDLEASMVELSSGILLSVQSKRCTDDSLMFRPLEQWIGELEKCQRRSCILRRNGNPNSNFFTVTATGSSMIWIHNAGDRSLRFQMPDGAVYRVCGGYTEVLAPSNTPARIDPIQVLLDLGDNPLDFCVSAVHVKYRGEDPSLQGGLDCLMPGTQIDSCICTLFCGDDCLGVLESHSSYFFGRPELKFLDVGGYGVSQWFVRNKGDAPLPLTGPGGQTEKLPADGEVYNVGALDAYCEKEEDA